MARTKSTLRDLAELILKNVEVVEADLAKRNASGPDINETFVPGADINFGNPEVSEAIYLTTCAAQQLLQTIRPPQACLIQEVSRHVVPPSLRCATELHVAEILSEAGPEGLHVKSIASKCGVDPLKLAPVLRCLTTRWIFKEVRPDVFANNRLSSVLHKGQTSEALQQNPEKKYDLPKAGICTTIGNVTDMGCKSSAYLYETLSDPDFAFSNEPNRASFNKGFNTNKTLWEFYEDPAQSARLHRFNTGMQALQRMQPVEQLRDSFDWVGLRDDALVVDVGGGIGSVPLALVKLIPKLKFVVQDMPLVVEDAQKRWKDEELVKTGRISFQAHDFFEAQPIQHPDVFFLQNILHDWSDKFCLQILSRLREAAGPETRLFVRDRVIPYTCLTSDEDNGEKIPGVLKPTLPKPLTAVGGGDPFAFTLGLGLMVLANGGERTLNHTIELYRDAGWKVETVHQFDALGRAISGITAVPI
ncbi:S-adenosyl-L-methionine-dependent methyltransferase [Schizopora paradoxa]|uniref:S-adenosyl-L-methionine-dependent methyltransferase n=1 Tax=Schizopora paradoxa TaxID=27342 RepID=A0A0H2R6J0_9AGAM|nr:S-adenosyl-L-methionine-dependent methyltransferase [Schizopora paradoxa]